jgi:hypothetical protein
LAALRSPILLEGNARIGYRDPLLVDHQGRFHLFFTLGEQEPDGRIYLYVAHSTSPDLTHWSPARRLTPRDLNQNFVSPGSLVRHAGQWVLCMSTYPRPGDEIYGNANARLFVIRSPDLERWSAPELIRVKGPDVPVEKMGRMIDAYLMSDKDDPGRWWCLFKQQGVSMSWSRDLEHWTYAGHTPAGENVCVLVQNNEYVMFHSPRNGIGVLRSTDLKTWRLAGPLITLGQADWPWARGRITAGYVADLRARADVGRYVMVFHGTGPEPEPIKFCTYGCIGIAWSDDLVHWDWPGKSNASTHLPANGILPLTPAPLPQGERGVRNASQP